MVVESTKLRMSNGGIQVERLTSFPRSLSEIPTSVLTEIVFKACGMDLSQLRIDRLSLRQCLLRQSYPDRIIRVVKVCHPHISLTQFRIGQSIFRVQFDRFLEVTYGGVNCFTVAD